MKYVGSLDQEQTQALQQLYRNGQSHRERQRAHALLWSAKGYTLSQLSAIFDLDRDTLSEWMDVYTQHGVGALRDAPKTGRPRKLDAATRTQVVQEVRSHPSPQAKTHLLNTLKKTV